MIANGITADLPIEDAIGVCAILLDTDRTIHPGRWVDAWIQQVEADSLEGLL